MLLNPFFEISGLIDFGTHALNILRLEKGFRGWGAEMTLDTTLVEAGMTSFVDFKKVKMVPWVGSWDDT